MPPQVNATLTLIVGGGTGDDWDRPGNPGAEKWAGSVRGYYREKVDRRAAAGGGVDVVVTRTLWVDTADVPDELDTDDVITVVPDAGTPVVAPAKAIARSRLRGIPKTLQTTRIDLEDG